MTSRGDGLHGRIRVAVVALVAAVALSLVACDRDESDDTDGADGRSQPARTTTTAQAACTDDVPAGRSERTVTVGEVDRSYLLYVPRGATDGLRPLVVTMHGFGSNATQQVAYTGIEAAADRHGFAVVAPNGTGTPPRFDLLGVADVGFVEAAIDDASDIACVDPDRVYATGMSNGGAMSSVLGCRAPERFAAIAPVAAIIFVAPFCTNAPPIPIIAFMGDADPVVPFNGGKVNCCGNPTIGSAPEAMAGWAAHNGCDAAFTDEDLASDVVRRTWTGCDGGADTVFHIVEGGGHTWPGAIPIQQLGATTSSIDATEAIWEFFAAHDR